MQQEWHVLDVGQRLASDNGSAILTVAQHLVAASRQRGNVAWIVGGAKGADLPFAKPILNSTGSRGWRRVLDRAGGVLVGRPFGRQLRFSTDISGESPDVVVAHNLPWVGRDLRSEFPSVRLVLYVHNKLLNRVPQRACRSILAPFDEIICVSKFVQRDLEARTGLKNDARIRTVHNAFPDIHDGDGRQDIDVAYVGRLIPEKGVHVLLQAAASASRGWKMLVVGGRYFNIVEGNDPYEASLKRLAADAALRVEFTGPIPPTDALAAMSRAKIVVVPSIWDEPCPLSLLEAMAGPAAAVATRVGGMPEISTLGGVVYVDPDEPEQLRAAIQRLLDDPAWRQSVAATGQREASQYSWSDAYEEALLRA